MQDLGSNGTLPGLCRDSAGTLPGLFRSFPWGHALRSVPEPLVLRQGLCFEKRTSPSGTHIGYRIYVGRLISSPGYACSTLQELVLTFDAGGRGALSLLALALAFSF